jgi:predicted O-methyltransferase YrrM
VERKKSKPDRSKSLQGSLSDILEQGSVVSRLDGTTHQVFPVAISPMEGDALRVQVTRERATRTLEIGLGYGIAALFVCDGLLRNEQPAPRHVAIDPNQESRFGNIGRQLIADAGLGELVEFHERPSEYVLPRLAEDGQTFDLAVVDGNHRFDGVFLDLVYLMRLVKPGGVVFLDDYQLPSVARAATFFVTNLGWRLEEVSAPNPLHQWAVLRTSEAPDRRRFDHFVEF